MSRHQQPVFVIGCHRSGTNLLYDTLQSAGGFAVYRAFLPVYEVLLPRFGGFGSRTNRQRLMETLLHSKLLRRTGLDAAQVQARILADCRSGGDFIRIIMQEIANAQNADRWSAYGPDNILFMRRIKREIPNALLVHILRDGRDIAVTLTKMGGLRPLPWDKSKARLAAALFWKWTVKKGRAAGREFPSDYYEVHFEDLVLKPAETLAALGQFLDHDLDYARIQAAGIGRVSDPNSSFKAEQRAGAPSPIGRWRTMLGAEELAEIECLIGDTLREAGYPTSTERPGAGPHARMMGAIYAPYFEAKLWARSNTPLGRITRIGPLELDPSSLQQTGASGGQRAQS